MNEVSIDIEDRIYKFSLYIKNINAQFLSDNMNGYVFHEWIYYRDSSRDWFAKDYVPQLNEAQKIIEREPTGHYIIPGTEIRDYYIYNLLESYRVCHCNESYNQEIDELLLQENIKSWKREILKSYNREEHIQHFILSNFAFIKGWNELRYDIYRIVKEIIPNTSTIDFDVVQFDGMTFRVTDYSKKQVEMIKNGGVWGRVVSYGLNKSYINDYRIIKIPKDIYVSCIGTLSVSSIGDGVFESLTDCEEIYLPPTILNIKWSFWHCRNLKNIHTELYGNFRSIKGVLFDYHQKKLIAYPNNHGKEYVIPEGVEEICSLAFKDCTNVERLFIPSTIKKIGLNAFYRCENLKEVHCRCDKKRLIFEGFQGNSGNVNPIWHYEP